jgi:hypothetical protein
MDNQIAPLTIYTTTTLGNKKSEGEEVEGEDDYISGDQANQDEQEQRVVIELLNISNLGFAIKATNDFITTQQGEH